jgi:hypothetical protein
MCFKYILPDELYSVQLKLNKLKIKITGKLIFCPLIIYMANFLTRNAAIDYGEFQRTIKKLPHDHVTISRIKARNYHYEIRSRIQ